jgi:hypothetical protein
MANSIDTNHDLQETDTPHHATPVRFADEARGRTALRATGANAKGPKKFNRWRSKVESQK